jgi:putative transposase
MSGELASLYDNRYYHVFNRSVGDEKLFVTRENYRYFLEKLGSYLSPVSDLFCYNLLPRHFNLFIRMKNAEALCKHMELLKYRCGSDGAHISQFLLEQFSNCFNSYAKAFNKQRNRKGRLFMEPFRRKRIRDPTDFVQLIRAIHTDPVHKGLCKNIDDWPHSSYHSLCRMDSMNNGWLCPDEVMGWFGSAEQFRKQHGLPAERLAW